MTELPQRLASAFGLAHIDEDSLTPWATVLRGRTGDGQDVVVKVTATKPGRAEAMAAWTTELRSAGLPVVSPVRLAAQNPQRIDDSWWVVYPFIDGRGYRGGIEDARDAGDLLGRLHAAEIPDAVLRPMRQYAYPETEWADAHGDLETLQRQLPEYLGAESAPLLECVQRLLDRWWTTALPTLRAADAEQPLPRTAVSSDYRSTNIVHDGHRFVLVDPDNGGVEPRLYELAMAVVLFHREVATAPGRLFSPQEWQAFRDAYLAHVTLTAEEVRLWPHALDHMLWEEGTWALEDTDAVGWVNPRERRYLIALAVATPEDFPLD